MVQRNTRVGMVVEDAALAHAIYARVLELTPNPSLHMHYDIGVYARELKQSSEEMHVYEGTETMRTMDIQVTLFPDREISEALVQRIGRTEVAHGLKPVTSLEDKEGIDNWACAIVDLSEKRVPSEMVVEMRAAGEPDKQLAKEASRKGRHANEGFVGIQGGLGAESGNEAFKYLTEHHDVAVFLMSQPRIPDLFEGMAELRNAGMKHTVKSLAIVDMLDETSRKFKAIGVDVTFKACNTIHALETIYEVHDELTKREKAVRSLNTKYSVSLIEKGVEAIPEGATVLELASSATIEFNLYGDEAQRQGRGDISWIVPVEARQAKVHDAIIHGLNTNKHKEGQDVLRDEILHHLDTLHEKNPSAKLHVLAACTEVARNLPKDIPDIIIIEPTHLALNEAAEISKEKSNEREVNFSRHEAPDSRVVSVDNVDLKGERSKIGRG